LDKVYLQATLAWKGLGESLKLPNNNTCTIFWFISVVFSVCSTT
jgi:hypothetical protein